MRVNRLETPRLPMLTVAKMVVLAALGLLISYHALARTRPPAALADCPPAGRAPDPLDALSDALVSLGLIKDDLGTDN